MFRGDYQRFVAAFMMLAFAAISFYRWTETHLLFFILVIVRDLLAAFFFFKRQEVEKKSSRWMALLSYVSAGIPLCYLGASTTNSNLILISNILSILGFLLVALATLELGTSIGISPAKRKKVNTGVYRWIKHPMYLGYGISEIGLCLVNPHNSLIVIISFMLYYFRIAQENKLLNSPEGKQ